MTPASAGEFTFSLAIRNGIITPMPNTHDFPFRRILIDHVVRGGTRVWWWLDPRFNDPGPLTFQLQVSRDGAPNARSWENVGSEVVDGFTAVDDDQRAFGKTLSPTYRVALTSSRGIYVSQPASVFGELTESDLIIAREILRKEQLRGRKKSWRPGSLYKRMHYGAKCTRCRDQLTGETTDANCPQCFGTGVQEGYHPAYPLCLEFITQRMSRESTDIAMRGSINDVVQKARCLSFPMLRKNDIWVDGRSGEAFIVDETDDKAEVRGVPLVVEVTMGLLPYSHKAYTFNCPAEEQLPGVGDGCVTVDHNYGEAGAFRYTDAEGDPIADADVIAFQQSDAAAAEPALPRIALAVAATTTSITGDWAAPLLLNPGDYLLVFRKQGFFGPDRVTLTVERPAGSSSSVSNIWDP